eukprot:scaffold46627_cov35-Phaeocystis_antarctica.AAC.1
MSLIMRGRLIAKAHCSTMRAFALGNNEPIFREIISPREMSTIENISTVRVSFDPKFTQTVLVHSLLGISQGDIISQNLAGGSLLSCYPGGSSLSGP